ncbi:cell division protein FtsZ [Flavobacterium sp. HSC-61S13]|uniref:cell division protein FtsZ n=1 Tax=Flavobacterium sp. HSC-61S13 TaxID=2910963 RepID=UPI00209FA981|nr:cell division protein FtsZ [Flavobacterium sp. HSC-61S13]MCP1994950.1 cell division protein FtsZ [Flavobacterium sp. HSC-61S13]
MENTDFESIKFDLPKNQSNVIKVIGVGGGGSNAINHMFKQGIKGVDFVVCNTDSQALQNSTVPNKIQLGINLTEGLGAGANPEVGQQSALESIEEIEKMLDVNTKMVFITAGMGGGTGTGAAPVIAQLSKERNILTVGIVTIPFQFEGKVRQEQALKGVERLRKNVDSLIVINNNKLREVYGNLGFKAGFSKADEVLATASRGIAEVITHHYTQNIDLKDAKTVLSDSGTAIMGSAIASGETRAKDAIVEALDSPLLNDNKITGAKNVLLLIVSGTNEITIDEIGEINDHIQTEAGHNANIIMGVGEDESLGESVAVTIIATGFNVEQQKVIVNSAEDRVIVHALEEEQKVVRDLSQKNLPSFNFSTPEEPLTNQVVAEVSEEKVVFGLDDNQSPIDSNDQGGFEVEKKTIAEVNVPENEPSDLDVFFEIVTPAAPVVSTPDDSNNRGVRDIRDMHVVEPEFVIFKKSEPVIRDKFEFEFDVPKQQIIEEEPVLFHFAEEVNQIQVNEAKHIISSLSSEQRSQIITKAPEDVVRYSLEDYMEIENELLNSKNKKPVVEEVEETFSFSIRTAEELIPMDTNDYEDISPVEMSIEEMLRNRTEERKKKMKDFNYKFNNANTQLNDLEKEPAYKRMGIDLNAPSREGSQSRMSLGTDSNNDSQLRSNNSFLHDNVD